MSTRLSTTRPAFSMIELVLVVVIMGIIVTIAAPRFADAGSGRRLNAATSVIERDINAIQLRAKASGKVHTLKFYPDDEMYVAFEGTDINRNAIVLSRQLDADPLSVGLSRTNIGGDETIVISAFGEFEKSFTVRVIDEGIEKEVQFTATGFTRDVVTESDDVLEIKTGILDLSLGEGGLKLDLGF